MRLLGPIKSMRGVLVPVFLRRHHLGKMCGIAGAFAVAIALTVSVDGAAGSQPGLLVYEPFHYPALANGACFAAGASGTQAHARGITGRYSLKYIFGTARTHTATYDETGLNFPGLQTNGGAITLAAPGNGVGSTTVSVRLAAPLKRTTLYGGYLFRSPLGPSPGFCLIIGDKGSRAYWKSAQIISYPKLGNARCGGVGGNNIPTSIDLGTGISAGRTYLVLFKVQGVNAVHGPVAMTQWILTDAQYQHFAGRLDSRRLDAAPLGTGADDVLQRAVAKSSPRASYPWFNRGAVSGDGSYLTLSSGDASAVYDEIRFSERNLAQVAPAVGAEAAHP